MVIGAFGHKLEAFSDFDDFYGKIVIPILLLQPAERFVNTGFVNSDLEGILEVVLDILSFDRLLGHENEGFYMGI